MSPSTADSGTARGPVAEAHRLAHDLGRGVIGALIFAMPYLYTMETWWLSWRLPGWFLVAYAFLGLVAVSLIVRQAGFRESEKTHKASPRQAVVDTIELAFQSFLAAFIVLSAFGIIEWKDSPLTIARLLLIQLVPLALGAAIANRALSGGEGAAEAPFPKDVALFAVGAVFLALPLVPTEEMERIAAHATWVRMPFLIVMSLLLAYLVLFELEFRGQPGRVLGLTPLLQVGEVFLVYGVATVTSFALLAAFGHFNGTPPSSWVQETVVLAFVATLGGSAARVVF